MLTPAVKLYTVDEFEEFIRQPENRDRRWQLIHGRLVEKMPTQLHGKITSTTIGELYIFFSQHPIGWVANEVRHRLPGDEHNARLPDVCVYLDTKTPPIEQGPVPYMPDFDMPDFDMPDFAIEVQSPDDSMEDLRERADYFLANGSKLVWLMYPKSKTVEVCTLKDGRLHIEVFKEHDTLSGGDILPGFTLPLKKIFPA